jgi:hypothetical protein
MATPVCEDRAEAAALERRLSDLVNEAYGLTSEELDLLWDTAPDAQVLRRAQGEEDVSPARCYSAASISGRTHILTACSPAA